MIKIISFLILLFCIKSISSVYESVLLSDVKTITLYKDSFTTGKRNSPIPQLSCIGGSAKSEHHKIDVVQCYNMGFDGNDFNWKCETSSDDNLKLGQIFVNCEGYSHPNDPYVLQGSCGLEYKLEYTSKYYNKLINKEIYSKNSITNNNNELFIFWYIFFIILVICFIASIINYYRNNIPRTIPINTSVNYYPNNNLRAIPINTSHCACSGFGTQPTVIIDNIDRSSNSFTNGLIIGSTLTSRPCATPYNSPCVSSPSLRLRTNTEIVNDNKDVSEHNSTSYGKTKRR